MNTINTAFGNIEELISAKNKRLLIVDDDPHQRKSIFDILNGKDISITTVKSGQEALDRLNTDRFHCIVLDLTLPDMTGSELLEKIRTDERLAHIPVIVHTDKELHPDERAEIE